MEPAEPLETTVSNERVVRTYDQLSHVYDWFVGPLEASARRQAIDFLALDGDERVLEVGCGPGHALTELATRVPNGHVFGLDAARGMLDRARRRRDRRSVTDRVSLLRGDARRLPVRSDSMDAVFIEATLELFSTQEMRTVLEEISRVLDADGRLCVVTMERDGSEDSRFVRFYEWAFEHLPGYRAVGCRPVYARRALEETGFEIHQHLRAYHAGVWPLDLYLAESE